MAKDKTDTLEADRPTVAADVGAAVMPKLWVMLGRGQLGKSTCVRWAAERAFQHGRVPLILDADRTNATLSAFFEGVMRPRSAMASDVEAAINDLVEYLIDAAGQGNPTSAFVDLGGGDLILKEHAATLDLVDLCQSNGVEPVAIHFLGDDPDDLAYLRDIEESGAFCPKKTLIVMNAAASRTGGFDTVKSHEIFLSAIKRGCRPVIMPKLQCMGEINKQRMQFQTVAQGKEKLGATPVINRQYVTKWLRAMDEAFAPFADWLP